jgi:peptide methionine sulfoxide reductase MsrB
VVKHFREADAVIMAGTTYNELTAREKYVIESKGTEPPFTGEYDDFYEAGTYICRRCNATLYRSTDKFDAGCLPADDGPAHAAAA